jgi:hypothetical protein
MTSWPYGIHSGNDSQEGPTNTPIIFAFFILECIERADLATLQQAIGVMRPQSIPQSAILVRPSCFSQMACLYILTKTLYCS